VKIDANLDGSFERNFNFNSISGIHTKGIFSCSSGASNCTYYSWEYSSGRLSLTNVNSTTANAPYCINDSCGSLYSSNPSQILSDVSGIIVALIQTSTSLVVTNINTSNTSAEIYAQKYDNCSESSATTLYNSSSTIPSEATIQSQASVESTSSETSTVISTILYNEETNIVTSSDLSDIKSIVSTARSNVSVESSDSRNVSYTNSYKDESGNFITSSDNSSINFQHIEPEYCMVEWEEVYSSVTTDNNIRGVTASGLRTTKKTETRQCSGEYNNICPVIAEETIKYDCGNLGHSINQATAVLNVLKGVVEDMICNITN
jgi:hypothetical protein